MYNNRYLNQNQKIRYWLRVLLPGVLVLLIATESAARNFEAISALIEKKDSIAISDPKKTENF